MYKTPPLVGTATVAAVAGTATGTIVAAPGAGFRIRLVGCQLGSNRAAGVNIEVEIRNGVNRIVHNYGLTQGAGYDGTLAPPIPEPGIVCDANTALVGAVISSAATGNGVFTVYYYIDAVT